MIEQGIYFALGCIVTALLAMAFAPIFWSRALRLTRRRLQLQVPLSVQEILADRDQLRAHFAVEQVRIEQAMERVQASKATDMAEIGRRTMEATSLAETLAVSRNLEQQQEREIARLNHEAAEASAQQGSLRMALYDVSGQAEQLRRHLEAETHESQILRDEAQDRRATIASLETRAMGLEMRILDGERAHAATEKRNEAALRSRLEAAMGQATRHESSALSLQRERDEAKAQVRALEESLEAAREREKGVHLQRSMQSERAKSVDRTNAEKLDTVQAENEALQRALAMARRQNVAPEDDEEADGGLRASIHALGLAVAVLSREGRDTPMPNAMTLRPKATAPSDEEVSS